MAAGQSAPRGDTIVLRAYYYLLIVFYARSEIMSRGTA